MEQEFFLSGYCRCLDKSRMVTLVTEDGRPVEVDCGFSSCLYAGDCTVAAAIREALESGCS